ncbi:hypothetical protein ACGYKD_18110 [Sulfitobacter sp. TB366]|uniref:hypothetical protein n=1 Tax=unclassified Sulfitobacter TaxID=196795 RepID=UPI0037475088
MSSQPEHISVGTNMRLKRILASLVRPFEFLWTRSNTQPVEEAEVTVSSATLEADGLHAKGRRSSAVRETRREARDLYRNLEQVQGDGAEPVAKVALPMDDSRDVAIPIKRFSRPALAWRSDLAVVDGADVLAWEAGRELQVLRSVIDMLVEQRRTPHVVLDAAASHLLFGHAGVSVRDLRKLLKRDVNIEICPNEVDVATRTVELADYLRAPIVSNDSRIQKKGGRHIPRFQGYSVQGISGLLAPIGWQ